MLTSLRRDLSAVMERDPAARNRLEVILLYPGYHALVLHRLAHHLWIGGHKMSARVLSALAYRFTQVDIHPGAQLGSGLFIDHASGVVIGETAEVGEDVTIYHQVTLGGRGTDKGKRHPTIGDRVTIGAGAKVLGPISVGDDSRVGANAVVVRDVPSGSVVVGVPGQTVAKSRDLPPVKSYKDPSMPDALGDGLRSLIQRVDEIETTLVGQLSSNDIRPLEDGRWKGEDFSI